MKKQALIYARQSSGADDHSESVEVQIANCRKLAGREQLEITGIFSDLNISGKTYPEGWEDLAAADKAFQRWSAQHTARRSCRPALGKVMKLLDKIDYIIVDDITRLYRPLTRSFLESAVNDILIANNVKILQVKGGKLDLSQFDQQLVTMLKNQINDEQIAKQRQRSIEVLNRLRDSGIMPTGITAFGLIYDKTVKRYTADPEKIKIVKTVFQRVLAGDSFNSIVRQINRDWRHLLPGCCWSKTIYEILRKPIYAGWQYNTAGELIKNHQGEGVIALEDFLEVQKILTRRRLEKLHIAVPEPKKHWLPLSGMLFCGNCRSRLLISIEDNKVTYICRRGSLCQDNACRKSRISMSCSKPYLAGLIDVVQTALGVVLCRQQKTIYAGAETFLSNVSPHSVAECEKRLQAVALEFARGNLPLGIFQQTLSELNKQLRSARQQEHQRSSSLRQQQMKFEKLLENYQNNSFEREEFEELLADCTMQIYVYAERIEIKVDGEVLEFARITRLRQKGFSAHMAGKLRRRLANIMKKRLE